MDIKAKIEELVEKIQNDPALLAKFKEEPVKTIEGLVGIDLPDDQIEKLVNAIKAKIAVEGIGSVLGGLGNLFGKK